MAGFLMCEIPQRHFWEGSVFEGFCEDIFVRVFLKKEL